MYRLISAVRRDRVSSMPEAKGAYTAPLITPAALLAPAGTATGFRICPFDHAFLSEMNGVTANPAAFSASTASRDRDIRQSMAGLDQDDTVLTICCFLCYRAIADWTATTCRIGRKLLRTERC